jgi:hypothetical protein
MPRQSGDDDVFHDLERLEGRENDEKRARKALEEKRAPCAKCGGSGTVSVMRVEIVRDENGEPGGERVADGEPCHECSADDGAAPSGPTCDECGHAAPEGLCIDDCCRGCRACCTCGAGAGGP